MCLTLRRMERGVSSVLETRMLKGIALEIPPQVCNLSCPHAPNPANVRSASPIGPSQNRLRDKSAMPQDKLTVLCRDAESRPAARLLRR